MRGNIHDVVCFFLRRVFHDDGSEIGLTIGQVDSIVSDVKQARKHVQEMVETFQGTTAQHEYVAVCAKAMTLYFPCDEVAAILQKFDIYSDHYQECKTFNEDVVNMLSLLITRRYRLPFLYVQRHIWARNFPQVTYDLSTYDGSGGEYYVEKNEENSRQNWLIDSEMECETRMIPLPVHPMLSAREIMLLQTCVQQTQYMCMQLPSDIASVVCKRIHGDYTVSPHVGVKSIVRAIDGSKACLQAPQLVYIAHVCGNVSIDEPSAFWMCCKYSMPLRQWNPFLIDDETFEHLARFPEVDPELHMKIVAVMTHPSWASVVSDFDE